MDNLSSIMGNKLGLSNTEKNVINSGKKNINDASILENAKSNITERLLKGKDKVSQYGFGDIKSPIVKSKNELEKKIFSGTTKVKQMTTKNMFNDKINKGSFDLANKMKIGNNKLNIMNIVKPRTAENPNPILKQKMMLGDLQIKNKMLAGSISINDKLGWNRMRMQKGLNMFGDFDKDGKVNILDCNPRNKKKQGSETVDGTGLETYGLAEYDATTPQTPLEPLPAEFPITSQPKNIFGANEFIPETEVLPGTSIPTPGQAVSALGQSIVENPYLAARGRELKAGAQYVGGKVKVGAQYVGGKAKQGLQYVEGLLEEQSKPDSLTQQKIQQAKQETSLLLNLKQQQDQGTITPENKKLFEQLAQKAAKQSAQNLELTGIYEKTYKKEAAKLARGGKTPSLFKGTKDVIAYDAGGNPFIVRGKGALVTQPVDEFAKGMRMFSLGMSQGVGMAGGATPAGIARASSYNINTENMMALTRGVGEMPYDQKVMQMVGRIKQQEQQDMNGGYIPPDQVSTQQQTSVADNYAVGYKKLPDGRYLNLKTKKVVTYPRGTYKRQSTQAYPQ